MGLVVLPKKFYDALDTQNALLASIASHVGSGGIAISNWEDVQMVVRMGLADKLFAVGDQFVSGYGESEVVWDIIGIDHDTPTDPRFTHSLTLQAHDCISPTMLDGPEALYYAETELPAGSYTFNDGTTDYTFTLESAVPAGGQVVLTWTGDPLVVSQIKTYATKTSTEPIETVAVTEGSTGATLNPINDINRTKYGSNNYKESAIRQWLNSSEASFVWTPQTNYDRPPTSGVYSGAGFLHLLDPDLAAVLGAVDKVTAKNTITDGGGTEVTLEKVFLLSTTEVYSSSGLSQGNPYAYYRSLASSATNGALAGRIKYLSGTPRFWWLRSPQTNNTTNYHVVYRDNGQIAADYANKSNFAIAPALCIV